MFERLIPSHRRALVEMRLGNSPAEVNAAAYLTAEQMELCRKCNTAPSAYVASMMQCFNSGGMPQRQDAFPGIAKAGR